MMPAVPSDSRAASVMLLSGGTVYYMLPVQLVF